MLLELAMTILGVQMHLSVVETTTVEYLCRTTQNLVLQNECSNDLGSRYIDVV